MPLAGLPAALTAPGSLAGLPVLATQGITEEQSLANLIRTHTAEQGAINAQCIEQLAAYHERRVSLMGGRGGVASGMLQTPPRGSARGGAAGGDAARAHITALLARARGLLRSPPDAKNVELLQTVAALTRRLGGGRLTLCSNGRDRASMSLTLEHGHLLQVRNQPRPEKPGDEVMITIIPSSSSYYLERTISPGNARAAGKTWRECRCRLLLYP